MRAFEGTCPTWRSAAFRICVEQRKGARWCRAPRRCQVTTPLTVSWPPSSRLSSRSSSSSSWLPSSSRRPSSLFSWPWRTPPFQLVYFCQPLAGFRVRSQRCLPRARPVTGGKEQPFVTAGEWPAATDRDWQPPHVQLTGTTGVTPVAAWRRSARAANRLPLLRGLLRGLRSGLLRRGLLGCLLRHSSSLVGGALSGSRHWPHHYRWIELPSLTQDVDYG